jgi:hypothetical protein
MDTNGIVGAVASQALTTGFFDSVNKHQPLSPPGHQLTAAVWAQEIAPVPVESGLAATTALLMLSVRLYMPALSQPYDDIDPIMLQATDTLMAAYSGAFTLGGEVNWIDLLGRTGQRLTAKAGYLDMNGQMLRVMTISVPMVVENAWPQVA